MAKKLVGLQVHETSGVDHPAHLHEGFLVMKAADTNKARAVLAALGKDTNLMAGTSSATPAAKAATPAPALSAEAVADIVAKAIDSKLQPILDGLAQSWQELRQYAESADDATPTPADAAPAAPADVLAGLDPTLAKALPEAVTALLKSRDEDLRKAREDIATERDARLDQEAIAKAKDTFGNLGLPDEFVKAVRRISAADEALGKSLNELLVATNAQLDGAPLLKELGTSAEGVNKSATVEVEDLAKALVADGTHDTIQKARVAVYEARPDLVAKIREGVAS